MAMESGVQLSGILKPMAAGAMAGTTVDLFFYPIDTLKTRLQSRQGFLASGGFKGVYKGLGSVAVGSAPGAALFFTTYDYCKRSIVPSLFPSLSDPIVHMMSASLGEVMLFYNFISPSCRPPAWLESRLRLSSSVSKPRRMAPALARLVCCS